MHEFSGLLVLKWEFSEATWGKGWYDVAMLTLDEVVLTFGFFYVCTNVGENRSRNATVRVRTDGYTDTLTDANRFYDLSHAICYS